MNGPPATPAMLNVVTALVSPASTSVSLVSTLPEPGVLVLMSAVSATATGASLLTVTLIVVTAVLDTAEPFVAVTLMMRATVVGFSVLLSNLINSIASAYWALVPVPASVTVALSALRVQVMEPMPVKPLGVVNPLISNLSPATGLVNEAVAPVKLALFPSNIELSVSAIETAGPFSVYVAAQL